MREATRHARGLGLSRREFLVSAAGTATALLAMNAAYAAAGNTGGFFALAADAAKDPQLAQAQLKRGGFIFDVQHFVDPSGQWLKDAPQRGQGFLGFPGATRGGEAKLENLGAAQFVKDVFLDSETNCMVLSFVPSTFAAEPLTIQEAAAWRRSSRSSTARTAADPRPRESQSGRRPAADGRARRAVEDLPRGRPIRSSAPTAAAIS